MLEIQKENRTNQSMAWKTHKTLKNEMSMFPKKKLPSHIESKGDAKNSVKVLELKKLSDQNLLLQTKNLVQRERNITLQVLRHLSEIEHRKLYFKRGFSSLFDYTVKELGYSEGSAYRRIKAMKLCCEVPETASKLKTGSLNLTTASKLQTYFEKQNKKAKKTQSELKLTNQKLDPCFRGGDETCKGDEICKSEKTYKDDKSDKSKMTDLTNYELQRSDSPARRRVVSFSDKDQKLELLKEVTGKSSRQTERLLCEIDPEICQIKDKVRYLNKDQVEMKLTLDKSSYESLERLKSLLSHKNPNMSYGELFKRLSELGLDKYDPERKLKNAVNSRKKAFENKDEFRGKLKEQDKIKKAQTKCVVKNRYIPVKVKQYIWTRDQGKCAYICPETQRRCSSQHLLQIDHIHPYSLGGGSEPANLRLLCAGHNQYRNRINNPVIQKSSRI